MDTRLYQSLCHKYIRDQIPTNYQHEVVNCFSQRLYYPIIGILCVDGQITSDNELEIVEEQLEYLVPIMIKRLDTIAVVIEVLPFKPSTIAKILAYV